MKFEFIETELDGKIDLIIVKAFCFGVSTGEVKVFRDAETNKYVIGFENGEDALHFKIKELDKVLIDLVRAEKSRTSRDLLTDQNTYITSPMVNIPPPYINTISTNYLPFSQENWKINSIVTDDYLSIVSDST